MNRLINLIRIGVFVEPRRGITG